MNTQSDTSAATFLSGGGAMGAHFRAHDWAATPLGPPHTWPPSLHIPLRLCLDSAFPVAIYWGDDWRLLYGDSWAPLLRRRHPWALGQPAHLVWPEIWPILDQQFSGVRNSGESFKAENLPLRLERDGVREETYWTYSLTPIRDEDGRVAGLFNIAHEVTAAVMTERRLRAARDRAHGIFDSMAEGFMLLDTDFRIREINAEGLRIDGRPAGQILGRTLWEAWPGILADASGPFFAHAMTAREAGSLEHRYIRGDRDFWVEARAYPSSDGGLALFYRDISARKAMEEALKSAKEEAERASLAKSKFLAAASHDLRQPLQSLLLFLNVLEPRVTAEGGEALRHLGRGLDAMKDLLDSLLDVSRLDAGAVQPSLADFPIGEFIDEIGSAYGPLAEAKGLAFAASPCDATVRSDRTLLARMVRNLVENALRYTETGHIGIACHAQGDGLRIEVRDSGIGIPPEHLNRIWEEFHQIHTSGHQRGREGLGLGLAIVQRLAGLLDHPVEVASEPGRGSVFTVRVPLAANPAEISDAVAACGAGSGPPAPPRSPAYRQKT